LVRVLLDAGANIQDIGDTPLIFKLHHTTYDVAILLLAAGVDVNARDKVSKN